MNFLELINKCLLELNYKQVYAFSELVKNDHKRIISVMNVINREICNAENWSFLLRRTKFTLNANTTEVENPVKGRILYLFIDNKRHDFCDDVEAFVAADGKAGMYSFFGDKLLFPKFKQDKTVDVIYYTSNSAVDENDVEKQELESPTDCSLIPMPFVQQLLVYGTCLRLKASPQYYKFSYWMSMYKEALANLRSKTSVSVADTPVINLFRQ